MFIESTSIDLFDQNMDMACAKVRLRCPCLLLKLIYLIKIWVCAKVRLRCIGIFDQYMSMACAKGRLRCSWISLVLIYFDQ